MKDIYIVVMIDGCSIAEHRIIKRDNDEIVFCHGDDSECTKTRKVQWYEMADSTESMNFFGRDE